MAETEFKTVVMKALDDDGYAFDTECERLAAEGYYAFMAVSPVVKDGDIILVQQFQKTTQE